MSEPAPNTIATYTLSNGARYVRIYIPEMDMVRVEVNLSVGSRDETPDKAGYAHCLEHFFFKGAEGYPNSYAIDFAIDRVGGRNNAYTDVERVAFYGLGLKKHMRGLLRVITRMVTRPLFPAHEWEHERHTVISELASRASDPGSWMWDALSEVAYGGDQPMAWNAAGRIAVVAKSTAADLEEYWRDNYDPSKMTIVVGGGATPEPDEVEKLVAAMPRGKGKTRVPAQWGMGPLFWGRADEQDPARQQTRIALALPGVRKGTDAASEIEELAYDVLAEVIAGGYSSPMETLVRRNPGLVSRLSAGHSAKEDIGMFRLGIYTTPQKQEQAVEAAIGILRDVAARPPSAAALGRAKELLSSGLARVNDKKLARVAFVADRACDGRDLVLPGELIQRIDAVDGAAVQRAAQRLVAQLDQVRFTFVHPVDPKTGRSATGQTVDEAGAAIRAAAITPPQLDRSIA
jgi:predicted Zn-dependent peptidase